MPAAVSANTSAASPPTPAAPGDVDVLAKYFRALGHPTRIRILRLLLEEELSVGDIVNRLGLTQPLVSTHLGCLRWCGLVATKREHRTVYYRLADERIDTLLGVAAAVLESSHEFVAACRVVDEQAVE